jgi:DNA polymerase III subunit gamma/tau
MAVQSLYRRYRPRRFSEVKGQEHVVRSLRNAVINHREGQAYLFSGPRGTGKTTSARILAKVLNCEESVDGEPCCECASCLAVEAGTSYDVHELDAASNNGVDAMRDLIDKASLGTPGRHKVYILDEVHMLSKAAEAALLKTLEEPPAHVVFVLATTDPQKVSDTIRSRTQHLQFHLLPMDVMEQHIRWLAVDAGLDVTDGAVQSVLRRGGGSARDTISALELIAAGGGDAQDETPLDEFVEALIESDPGRALAAVASVMRQGRDARTLTESLVAHLRDCFLSLMAPELVQLPDQRAEEVSVLAQRLGAASTVRGMEILGSMLVEMRHAPDPRVLLEVALVKLTSAAADPGVGALMARLERLEQQVARGGGGQPSPAGAPPAAGGGPRVPMTATGGPPPSAADPAPRDPTTGRAVLGGRYRAATPAEPGSVPAGNAAGSASAEPAARPTPVRADSSTESALEGAVATSAPRSSEAIGAESMSDRRTEHAPVHSASRVETPEPVASRSEAAPDIEPTVEDNGPAEPAATAPDLRSEPRLAAVTPLRTPVAGDGPATAAQLSTARSSLIGSLRPLAKAVLGAGSFVGERDGVVEFALPSEPLKQRANDQKADIERALTEHFARPLRLLITVDPSARLAEDSPASAAPPPPVEADEDIDVSQLEDAPSTPVINNIDRIAAAFPGSEIIEGQE